MVYCFLSAETFMQTIPILAQSPEIPPTSSLEARLEQDPQIHHRIVYRRSTNPSLLSLFLTRRLPRPFHRLPSLLLNPTQPILELPLHSPRRFIHLLVPRRCRYRRDPFLLPLSPAVDAISFAVSPGGDAALVGFGDVVVWGGGLFVVVFGGGGG